MSYDLSAIESLGTALLPSFGASYHQVDAFCQSIRDGADHLTVHDNKCGGPHTTQVISKAIANGLNLVLQQRHAASCPVISSDAATVSAVRILCNSLTCYIAQWWSRLEDKGTEDRHEATHTWGAVVKDSGLLASLIEACGTLAKLHKQHHTEQQQQQRQDASQPLPPITLSTGVLELCRTIIMCCHDNKKGIFGQETLLPLVVPASALALAVLRSWSGQASSSGRSGSTERCHCSRSAAGIMGVDTDMLEDDCWHVAVHASRMLCSSLSICVSPFCAELQRRKTEQLVKHASTLVGGFGPTDQQQRQQQQQQQRKDEVDDKVVAALQVLTSHEVGLLLIYNLGLMALSLHTQRQGKSQIPAAEDPVTGSSSSSRQCLTVPAAYHWQLFEALGMPGLRTALEQGVAGIYEAIEVSEEVCCNSGCVYMAQMALVYHWEKRSDLEQLQSQQQQQWAAARDQHTSDSEGNSFGGQPVVPVGLHLPVMLVWIELMILSNCDCVMLKLVMEHGMQKLVGQHFEQLRTLRVQTPHISTAAALVAAAAQHEQLLLSALLQLVVPAVLHTCILPDAAAAGGAMGYVDRGLAENYAQHCGGVLRDILLSQQGPGDVGPLKADALAAVWQQQPKLVTAGLEWIIRNSCSEVEPYRSALIPEDAAISVAGPNESLVLMLQYISKAAVIASDDYGRVAAAAANLNPTAAAMPSLPDRAPAGSAGAVIGQAELPQKALLSLAVSASKLLGRLQGVSGCDDLVVAQAHQGLLMLGLIMERQSSASQYPDMGGTGQVSRCSTDMQLAWMSLIGRSLSGVGRALAAAAAAAGDDNRGTIQDAGQQAAHDSSSSTPHNLSKWGDILGACEVRVLCSDLLDLLTAQLQHQEQQQQQQLRLQLLASREQFMELSQTRSAVAEKIRALQSELPTADQQTAETAAAADSMQVVSMMGELAGLLQHFGCEVTSKLPFSLCCANPECDVLGGRSEVGWGTTRCSACKAVRYCSKQCQREHWTWHKASCRVWKRVVAICG